jgi:hypothetical protein
MTSVVQPADAIDRPRPSSANAPSPVAAGLVVSRPAPGDWSAWDKLFSESLFATPFATSTYLCTLAHAFQRTLSVYLVSRGGEVIAGLALCGHRHLGASIVAGTPATQYSALLYHKSVFAST